MTIDFTHFTPGPALIGGLVIGMAAAVLVLFNGRIAGISGILGGLLERPRGGMDEWAWRAAFLLGLIVLAGLAYLMVRVPLANAGRPDEPAPPTAIM